jgi:hypothetical protein
MARLAPSLIRLRATIDGLWPDRDRRSDGWIGDAAHQARKSDHNPGPRDLVHAIDVDRDGVHVPSVIAAALLHPATSYAIHNRRIYLRSDRMRPRAYTGATHAGHIHVSILSTVPAETATDPWTPLVSLPWWPLLRQGTAHGGLPVRTVQALLNGHGASLVVDGFFGPRTASSVRGFQRAHAVRNSVVRGNGNGDGIVGPHTRRALLEV